ncbi:hybrid sensor histidine kinase/response regulator [Spirosoma endophyticum]|uniref:histidine kinase n=1 Tax=Spirosoma endophyticum TaxID=662367 RepID=A0A1I2E7H8_9BACT|nr:ATP-binding protein [Spirosoma endophyticum]SFE88892.1 His Kinase A (phospho-acceptor) domain-containing protein [Spirosoma endophyticum]
MQADLPLTVQIERVKHIPILPTLLAVICQTTGMGFAVVARVTSDRWIACQVRDEIQFGLEAGGELPIETTICQQIQDTHHPVLIEHVQKSQVYCQHPTPALYGFQSYISFPIFLPSGEFFGTLCAIDPQPTQLDTVKIKGLFTAFTELIAFHIQQLDTLEQARAMLTQQVKAHQLMEQAAQVMQQADQRKDEFLAMLAHELRNPLATVRSGLAILAVSQEPGPMTEKAVGMMNRQVNHLVHMVDDLLDVSRISRGKIELKTERVNLVVLVQQAIESVRSLFQQGRRLHVELPTGPIYLAGDATRLAQVVTNLLTNGARYTDEQGSVWLRLHHQDGEAILVVRDNGIGLPADQFSSIFELFTQVDNSLARSKGGLGLGLTLVKRLVELHGGRVAAQSAGLDQGSTFTVHLPTVAVVTGGTRKPIAETPGKAGVLRILVIDDNADAAMTLGMLLKLKGYEVHTRTSGRAGIEAAEQGQPEAILLDIGMPELDGYETCRQIRQQPWGQHIVVIALTGYGQEEDQQRTQAAGFDGHLVKPVDLTVLLNLMAKLLHLKQANSESDEVTD